MDEAVAGGEAPPPHHCHPTNCRVADPSHASPIVPGADAGRAPRLPPPCSRPRGSRRIQAAQVSIITTVLVVTDGAGVTGLTSLVSRGLSCSPGPLAHPEEQGTFNPKVPGSRPGRPTIKDQASGAY